MEKKLKSVSEKLKCKSVTLKDEVVISIEEGIAVAENELEFHLGEHNWRKDKRKNDRVLDVAGKCFKNNRALREIWERVKKLKRADKILEAFQTYEGEYVYVERDLGELVEVIKKA